ncbi:hypothetical protein JIX56_26955 [Streptomyces sp. CA-210063]|uniref:hypothetical protein n=1 Tax=Streptomyces sp. CA-210063 TaxID=2801029 RepID=UPI00214CE890|nr:hypothetical protein [Streptomyces sp. CA-210063]UUU33212.1 hypothetical protein JIX56_26955 [Streptomyces sp. CA-210063]
MTDTAHIGPQEHGYPAYGDDCVTVDDELWSAVADPARRYKVAVDSSSDEAGP